MNAHSEAQGVREFQDRAKAILGDYLQTALIIDDDWLEPSWGEAPDSDSEEIGAVPEEVDPDTGEEEDGGAGAVLEGQRLALEAANRADSQLLWRSYLALQEEGMVASGHRFRENGLEHAIKLGLKADIVVLDWQLARRDGHNALEILRGLRGQGLRFIFVYTEQRVESVREELDECFGSPDDQHTLGDIRIDNLVLAIRSKSGDGNVAPEMLFAEALKGLSRSYGGLVQLSLLELTARHRRELPRVLERVSRDIDAPVVLEGADTLSPIREAGSFLSILVDEWRAQLEISSPGESPLTPEGRSSFCEHLLVPRVEKVDEDHWRSNLLHLRVQKDKVNEFVESLPTGPIDWLRNGCEGELPGNLTPPKQWRRAAWAVLASLTQEKTGGIEDLVRPLLKLDSFFHQQQEPATHLGQGTVVQCGDANGQVLVCITPACDAERPDEIASLFSFIRAEPQSTEDIFRKKNLCKAYFVVRIKDTFSCFKALPKERVTLRVPSRAIEDNSLAGYWDPFDTEPSGEQLVKLVPLAQLRVEHALSLTASTSSSGSRIGVNRIEFLRQLVQSSN